MKTSTITFSIITLLLLSACGDSSGTTAVDESPITDITVERGPVLEAVVRDANGQIGEELGDGVYRFKDILYPVESFGGFIDMNRNGSVDAGDMRMQHLRLRTHNTQVMTLATTIANDENISDTLEELGYTQEQLLHERPSTHKDIAALSDELYKYCYENNISDPSSITKEQIDGIKEQIRQRKELYNEDERDAATLENELMDELNINPLTQEDALQRPDVSENIIFDAIEIVALSDEQKYTLAYMWNEERLAKDLYLNLNTLTPSQTLYNIATNAEAQHVEAVEKLIQRHDINILNTTDYSGGYDADALADYESGEYSIEDITNLYHTLYHLGSDSLRSALEVGCMVEVTDINDLNEDIEIVKDVEDLRITFENLRKGSYSHYWAFDTALKAQGVVDGCCSVGNEYCKTEDEYPKTNTSSNGSGEAQQKGKH